jgi:hypothetical protein
VKGFFIAAFYQIKAAAGYRSVHHATAKEFYIFLETSIMEWLDLPHLNTIFLSNEVLEMFSRMLMLLPRA